MKADSGTLLALEAASNISAQGSRRYRPGAPGSNRVRGFTLVEGLFSMLLTLLVLTALAETLSDTGKIRANRAEMDRAIEELHALDAVRRDIEAAREILRPGPGATTAELRLYRVNPELSFGDRTSAPGDAANPYEPDEMVEVGYRVQDEALLRAVGPIGDPVDERVQACHDLRVSRDDHTLTVSMTFVYSRVRKTRTMKVGIR